MIALKCRMAFLHEIPGGRGDGQMERERESEHLAVFACISGGG